MQRVLRNIGFLALLAAAGGAAGQTVRTDPPELRGIDVHERLGDTIPRGLGLVDEAGREVALGDYFGGDRPVLLVLGYYECPMLCNLVFNGLTEALPRVGLDLGRQYRVVTVSIDPGETPDLAAAKKASYLAQLGPRRRRRAGRFSPAIRPRLRNLPTRSGSATTTTRAATSMPTRRWCTCSPPRESCRATSTASSTTRAT